MAALAEALKEVPLTKAQLGLDLEELEAAALLVQEEETVLKAARSVSRQQTPSSSPETSDSEESDSTTSSETEGSDSERGELTESESETADPLRGPSLEGSSTLLIVDGGVCRNSATATSNGSPRKPPSSSQALGGSGPLIEELGEHLNSTVQVSEPEDSATGSHSSVRARDDQQTPSD